MGWSNEGLQGGGGGFGAPCMHTIKFRSSKP